MARFEIWAFMHWEPTANGVLWKAGACARKMNPGHRESPSMANLITSM